MSSDSRATPRRLAIITAVVGVSFAAGTLIASATEPDRHGYWKQDGIGALGAPAVDVPAGGLLVSKGLADEAAVSAMALRVDDATVTAVVLVATDREAEGGVLACPATSTWSEPDGSGAWTDRPDHDCETTSVAGVADEGTWTFDVAELVDRGVLDIVFVPEDAPAPFSIAFEAPSAATVQVAVTPAPLAPPTTSSGVIAPPVTYAPPDASPGFAPSPPAFEATPEPVVDLPPTASPDQTATDGPDQLGAPAADLDDLADAATGPSGLALVLVTATALATTAVWWWRRTRAAVELAAFHPLAGVPSLAGDSVRDAGRALVDDDDDPEADTRPTVVGLEMAR